MTLKGFCLPRGANMNVIQLQEAAVAIHNHRVKVVNEISTPAWQILNDAEEHINKQIKQALNAD